MKKIYYYIVPSLLISLFIYVFYRTNRTVVNDLFLHFITVKDYIAIKQAIHHYLPLNEFMIFSLPEGLWVFCITLTSKNFYIRLFKKELNLELVPIVIAIGLEIFQRFHFTNGRFDFIDVITAVLFWFIAFYFIKVKTPRQNLFQSFNLRVFICVFSYAIVYLAHVWQ